MCGGREIRAMQLWVYGHAALHELKAAVAQIVAQLKRGQHIPRSADRNWLFEDMAPLVDGRSLGCKPDAIEVERSRIATKGWELSSSPTTGKMGGPDRGLLIGM
jgi:hypothetical protein